MTFTRPGVRFRTVLAVSTLLPLVAGLLLMPGAAASTGRFDLEALGRLTKVSDPQISPDGRTIVVIVSRPN